MSLSSPFVVVGVFVAVFFSCILWATSSSSSSRQPHENEY
jgi:hypothetical protein